MIFLYRYAQIDENGIVFCDSYLSGIIEAPNLILIDFDFDLTNKKYENGKWFLYTPEPIKEFLSDNEQAVLDTALNVEYLVCLNDMGL